ncbi:reverse transcriptase domain-containing protein [Tanacetum coccineum]
MARCSYRQHVAEVLRPRVPILSIVVPELKRSTKGSSTESTEEALDFGMQHAKTKGLCKEGDAVVALHRIGTSSVINIVTDLGRPASDAALREYCNRNYHQLLPIIAEKVHQEKVQQEKLKAVKARLNFEEASQHSESGTPSRRRDLKKRLGSRHVRSMSGSPEPRRDHSESPRKNGLERKTMLKRLEKGVFHRLGDKGKSISTYSNDLRRRSYHSSRRGTESCYQSSRSKETEFASEKRHDKRESSRRMESLSESEGSAGGHWKSKPKRQKSSIEDDLSQP